MRVLMRGILFSAAALVMSGTLTLLILGQSSFLFPFYTILANLTLGLVVFFQDFRNRINASFFLITVAIALWTLGVYLFWNVPDIKLAFAGGRIAFLGASTIPAFMLFFSLVFPKELKTITFFWAGAVISPLIIFPVLVFSNLILKEVVSLAGGVRRVYGPAYPLFLLYYVLYFILFFYDLFLKERSFSGISRTQVRYVFLGFGVSAAIAFTTNLILPFFGIGAFSFIGPHATLFLVVIVAYAILKHRLMSIEVVIQRSTVYAVATVLIMSFYALAVMISEVYLRKVIGYTSLAVTALAALFIAIVYQPLVRSFQEFTDRLFFRGRYDYQKTLRKISHEIASVIKLEELIRLIASSFIDTMKISEISFLLPEKGREHFCSVNVAVPRYKKIEIDAEGPIVTWLSRTKDILVRDEVEDQPAVRDAMERLGISVWVPIISKKELIGIIALGGKLSGDSFTSEDLALLTTLANQTAVALDNARLYDEAVKNLAELKEMEEKVRRSDKLTALATMAAGMAHEIKNPLSSMKVFAQLLPAKIHDPEYRRKLEEILPREIDRIDRIVVSLLGFARATAPNYEKIIIEEVLEENLKYFEEKARNAFVTIKREFAGLPEIEVDRGQISQVFSNLILNGIQAMPEGGELTVKTFPGKKVGDVLQNVVIRVSDTGHGMPEEMLKKLFDPFFTTKYGGTGLGLTIAHSIVDGHRGFIDVESKVGKGTIFTVTLPVSQGLL